MYKIVTKSNYCLAGPNNLKTKQADGAWLMDWCHGNGTVVIYSDRAKAERDAKWLPTPTNGIVEAWAEVA